MTHNNRCYRILYIVCRCLLAAVFLFSGFVKGVDPWGTAIKFGEYFAAWGIDWLDGAAIVLAIALAAFEMTMGFALLLGLRLRFVSLAVMLFMIGFTGLTLWIALKNPVADCGCFGDAVKLSNWQTFYKNLILLPMSVCVCRVAYTHRNKLRSYDSIASEVPVFSDRREDKRKKSREWLIVSVFALMSVGMGVYALRHLPIIDFLPFRVGVNIPETINESAQGVSTTTLIYRDLLSGEEQEFALSDTTWYDTTRWEYVDTRIVASHDDGDAAIRDFRIFRDEQDRTEELLASSETVWLLCITSPGTVGQKCAERMGQLVAKVRAHGEEVLVVTPVAFEEQNLILAGESVPVYNIDGTTLKTLIRAKNGVVALRNGVIVGKWNCRDIPRK